MQGIGYEDAKAYRSAGLILDRQITKNDICELIYEIIFRHIADYMSGTSIDYQGGGR